MSATKSCKEEPKELITKEQKFRKKTLRVMKQWDLIFAEFRIEQLCNFFSKGSFRRIVGKTYQLKQHGIIFPKIIST